MGKRAAKAFRRDGTFQRGEQGFGIAVGNRKYGNFGDRRRVFDGQPLNIALGANARRERIAGIDRHVQHAAALHAVFIAHGTFGKDVVLEVAVVARIRIDDAADGTVLRGDFWA